MEQDGSFDDVVAPQQEGEPEIYALSQEGGEWKFNRRDFLATVSAVAAATAAGSLLMEKAEAQGTSKTGFSPKAAMKAAHKADVTALLINKSSTVLFSGSWDNTIKLWSLPSGALTQTIHGAHDKGVRALALSDDGKSLFSAGDEGIIKWWSLPHGETLSKFNAHTDGVTRLALAWDHKTLISCGHDETIKFWSIGSAPSGTIEKKHEISISPNSIAPLAVSHDQNHLCYANGKQIFVTSIPDAGEPVSLGSHDGNITSLISDPSGRLLSCSADGVIKIWSISENKLLETFSILHEDESILGVDSEGGFIVVSGTTNTLQVWTLPHHHRDKNVPLNLPFSTGTLAPNNQICAIACSRTITLWIVPQAKSHAKLLDIAATTSHERGVTFRHRDQYGIEREFTLPCGSPIPAGAVCVCNCVPGSYVASSSGSEGICTCNMVCTCLGICTCLSVCSCHGNCSCNEVETGHYWYPN